MDQIITKAVEKLSTHGHHPVLKIETETYVSYHCPRCGRYMVCEFDQSAKKWVTSGSLQKYSCQGVIRK